MISLNREKKLVDDYVVFDLETTGFDPKSSRIIEIGALKYRNNELVEELSLLVNPGCPIPDVITMITGIDDELVKNAISIEEAMPKFISFIEDLPLVAHNSKFDLSFILFLSTFSTNCFSECKSVSLIIAFSLDVNGSCATSVNPYELYLNV